MKESNHHVQKWLPLMVMSLAVMIIIIDTTVLNVSIRNIISDLKTDIGAIQWVISAYALVLAAFTITGGRLGDLYGRKRVFKIGAVLFAIGSLITALSPNIAWIIFGNAIVEGFGASLMMPATASLLVTHYQGKDRALAFAIWGSVAASAAAIGPILGGFLTSHYSWRWAFLINLVVVGLLLVGSKFIKEAKEHLKKIELDFLGIVLSATGLVLIVYGLIESSNYGWWLATKPFAISGHSFKPLGLAVSPIAILFGAIMLIAFAYYEKYHEQKGHIPLVSLKLFNNKQFTSGSLTSAIMAMGQTGLIFIIPIFYQAVKNFDALHTGLGLLPISLTVMISAPLALKLNKRFTPKQIIQMGFVLTILGCLYLFQEINTLSTAWSLAPGLGLYGFGMGFGFSQLGNLTLSAVSVEQSGEASGINNTLRQVGASFGSAIVGAALLSTLSSSVLSGIKVDSSIPESSKPAIVQEITKAGNNIEFVDISQISAPENIRNAITNNIHQATVKGNKTGLKLALIFAIFALLVSNILPNKKNLTSSSK